MAPADEFDFAVFAVRLRFGLILITIAVAHELIEFAQPKYANAALVDEQDEQTEELANV